MHRIIKVALGIILLIIISSCDLGKGNSIDKMIDKGEYQKARKKLTGILAVSPRDSESSILLAKTYRKEYYPTWNIRKYRSPLESEWTLFPAQSMNDLKQYQDIVHALNKRGIWNEDLEIENYFLLTYHYFQMKYLLDRDAEEEFKKQISVLINGEGELADNATLWDIYSDNNYSMDFDPDQLKILFEKYPNTELAGLEVLSKIFGKSVRIDKPETSTEIVRIKYFMRNYPEFALYADSLFIYKFIDDEVENAHNGKLKGSNIDLENYLIKLLAESISVKINRYILRTQAYLTIESGNIETGLSALNRLANQEQNRYDREKLVRDSGALAFRNGRYGLTISSLRQIEGLGIKWQKMLWESYIKMDNEYEADILFEKIKDDLTYSGLVRFKKIKYNYNLGKLKLSELNLVQGNSSVTIEGIVTNSTQKLYKGITVRLNLSDAKGKNLQSKTLEISELYPETEEKFNEFIDYKASDGEIKYSGEITGYKSIE
ncbi:MAG: FxLYD domain-containing protein [Candidatus Stygibacter australis]|nr:FxLYD domain-containing protein [Candidatus Stygibacter australis]MDP8321419.1 FxLYD domain-containing protein [Candidatus Stygibacter australis]